MALEARCAGVKQGFPNTENLQVNGADLPSVQQTIQSKLAAGQVDHQHRHAGRADRAGRAAGQSRAPAATAKIATFDLNQDAAQAIKDGKIAVLGRPAALRAGLPGRLMLWLNITNGNDLGGGKPVLTGPSIVDKTNIDQILPYTANNTR